MDRTRRGGLGAEGTEAVLRRAAELERQHGQKGVSPLARAEPRIDAAELERIAAESGLSLEAVRRALDEYEGGALEREKPRAGAADGAVARRTFEEPPDQVEARLSAALRTNGLAVVERAPHATRWEPAPGLPHALRRAVDWAGTSVWIGAAVESSVYAVPGQRSSAELRGDATSLKTPFATVAGLLLAFPAAVALLVVLALGLRSGLGAQHALAMLLVLVVWAALTALSSRGIARRRARKLRGALERILAELA